MPRIPLTSGAYSAPSIIANAQRCVNLYPERNPEETTPPVPVTHYPRPGLTPLGTPPVQGNTRCLYRANNGDLYQVIDQNVYYIDPDWNYTLLGSLLANSNLPVSMADNGVSALLVDGSLGGSIITLSGRTMALIGDPNFLGGTRADFIDGFLILNQPNTRNWYCTLLNSSTFNALYIGVKTAWPDNIISICAIERAAWIFGPQKSEVWFNAGAVPFPFQLQPGLIVEHGCVAAYSVAKQDTAVFWLSQSPEGARMAMMGIQQIAERISTHAIEAEWLTYPRVDDAIGSTYQIAGHAFYCLDFPTADKTWVYDQATKQWHEEATFDSNGHSHRSRVPFKAYAYGKNLGADWSTGQLYQIDPTNHSDNESTFTCIRSFPHLVGQESQRVTLWKVIADIEVGTEPGTTTTPVTTSPWSLGFSSGFGPRVLVEPPLISLRLSRSRGAAWGNAVMQPMGAMGLYYTRPTWNRMGYFVDGILELSWSTPMKTALNGVFVDVEPHDADV